MMGYRMYYDKERMKFIAETEYSEADSPNENGTEVWFSTEVFAKAATREHNEHRKYKLEDVTDSKDLLILECKDCKEVFVIHYMEIEWFRQKNLKIPVRCLKCRKNRKQNHK